MNTAKVTYQFTIKEYPKVIITIEVIVQWTYIILSKAKVNSILHTKV